MTDYRPSGPTAETPKEPTLFKSIDLLLTLAIVRTGRQLGDKFDAVQAGVEDIKVAREAFAELSESLVVYRKLVSGPDKPSVAYCSMAKANWLQTGQTVNNPSCGSKMLRCGSILSK